MTVSVQQSLEVRSKLFRGLADPSRLAILSALCTGEKTVGKLCEETGLSQSNVSNHMACLRDCGLVVSHQEWRYVYYRIADAKVEDLLNTADEIVRENAQRIVDCVNYRVSAKNVVDEG